MFGARDKIMKNFKQNTVIFMTNGIENVVYEMMPILFRQGPGLYGNIVVKSTLVKKIQTWYFIGWQHSKQPIRSQVRKFRLIDMDLNIDFC